MIDTITLEFVSVGCTEDLVAGYLRGDDLADNVAICETDDETVFRSVVLVLRLTDEAFTSVVIGFACTATLVLDLIAAADGLVSVALWKSRKQRS